MIMKAIWNFCIGMFVLGMVFWALSTADFSDKKENNQTSIKHTTTITAITKTVELPKPLVPVGEENFKKLVTYIEKNGFVVVERGVPCDHQYTFFDKDGNRHAMITSRRDKNFYPSMTAPVKAIDVWAYYKGIKDQKHFFGYYINEKEVKTFLFNEEYVKKHMPAVKKGYEEFLARVNNQKKH